MSKITFRTNLFGELEFDEDDMNKDILMDIDGRKIEITLWLWEDLISEQNYNMVLTFSKFINNIPNLYKMAKKEIESNYMEDEVIKFFIESQIDEIEEDVLLDYFDKSELSEITPEIFIKKLEPRNIWIHPEEDDENEIECVFDFSIDSDISDELLVFCFNEKMKIKYIAHES